MRRIEEKLATKIAENLYGCLMMHYEYRDFSSEEVRSSALPAWRAIVLSDFPTEKTALLERLIGEMFDRIVDNWQYQDFRNECVRERMVFEFGRQLYQGINYH